MKKRIENSTKENAANRPTSHNSDDNTAGQTSHTRISNQDNAKSANQNDRLTSTANVGECLQLFREQANLTVEDVSVKTKIKAHYITAIESTDISKLPSLTHSIGFVKIYAALFGLEQDIYAAKFRSEIQAQNQKLPSKTQSVHGPSIINPPESNGPSGLGLAIIVMALIIAVWAFMNFYLFSEKKEYSSHTDRVQTKYTQIELTQTENTTPDEENPRSTHDFSVNTNKQTSPIKGGEKNQQSLSKNDDDKIDTRASQTLDGLNEFVIDTPAEIKSIKPIKSAQTITGFTVEKSQTENQNESQNEAIKNNKSSLTLDQTPEPQLPEKTASQNALPSKQNKIEETETPEGEKNNLPINPQLEPSPKNDIVAPEPLSTRNQITTPQTPLTPQSEIDIKIIRGPSLSPNQRASNTIKKTKPQLLKKPEIQYPSRCAVRAKDIEKVQMRFSVDSEGVPVNPKIVSSTNDCFNRAALRSMKSARYSKVEANSNALEKVTLTVSFTKA